MFKKVRIGAGAGFAGDRWEPALELIEKGDIQYLVFETLAERTIAIGHLDKMKNPDKGYNTWLEARMRAILSEAKRRNVKIITNMGSANPVSAAKLIQKIARELELEDLRIAVLLGDDVTDMVKEYETTILETGKPLSSLADQIIAANAYLGADSILQALNTGADIVVTGRTADPSLFLAAMMHGLGWDYKNNSLIGQGSVVGHLMECAGQITGGYFADPGYKEVPNLEKLGFPICEVHSDGTAYITKVPGSGGTITLATCKEQMLYEIHDPSAYITPDCVVDFTNVRFVEVEKDCIQVIGGNARERTSTYKVSVGFKGGHIGEGQISYGGPGALERAELAADIVKKRFEMLGVSYQDLRIDFIGVQSLHGLASTPTVEPYEVRLRVVGRSSNHEDAVAIGREVQSLLTNGPYGGAGDFTNVRDVIAVASILLPRDNVQIKVLTKG